MPASDSIKRVRDDPFGLEFDVLKKEGLALVQGLSGASWTDYNDHDPGVTILDNLCFGLTELAYRSGFAMQDYLASKNGSIDFEGLALFKPEAIFPSQPVTMTDYAKLLFAAIPDLDDVRLTVVRDAEGNTQGLYDVSIRLYEALGQAPRTAEQKDAILLAVRRMFSAHRSLCEDIASLQIVPTQPCYLQGEIEIQGSRAPAEIYADIFFQCARKISSNIRIERYEDALARGLTREQIFTGPLTRQGYISDSDFEETRSTPTMAELVALVSRIDGVKQVHQLDLLNEKYQSIGEDFSCELSEDGLPCLRFPERVGQLHLLKLVYKPRNQLQNGASAVDANKVPAANSEADIKQRLLLQSAKLQLQKLEFEYRAFRNNEQAVDQFITLPRGESRSLQDYYSVQEQFPHIYGINREGVPGSAALEVKARAKQLKAYLFPFEQVMANYLALLHELRHLFSLDDQLQQTYFTQYLSNDELPNIEELYATRGGEVTVRAAIATIQARYDNYVDRRSRVLDVMLAMYGEEFSQEALQRFNLYRRADAAEAGQWVIENKIQFLRHLTEISACRGAAFDYLDTDAANIGSWQKRISILLGIAQFDQVRSLCALYRERKIELLMDAGYHEQAQSRALAHDDKNAKAIPLLNETHRAAKLALPLNNCKLSFSMLRLGVHHDSYRMVENETGTVLYFQGNPDQPLCRLSSVPNPQAAMISVRQFRNAIIKLNQESEGMHVIEHVLLRAGVTARVPEDFFAFRLSIVLPAWTARFADPEFRKLAEETICRQLPAHVSPSFYWLNFAQMSVFEGLQTNWLASLAEDAETELKRSSASALIHFLLQQCSKDIPMLWV
jgi:hypothetical protein